MTDIKNDLNGWLIIDKPQGMTSNGVVGRLKYLLHPQKIGHAGTLDPLATGVLPIALGKATRLIPFVMDDEKTYEFDVKWGIETDSDDLAGVQISTHDKRPTKKEILAVLPRFTGIISQTPSPYSAIKINGNRAYDLARKGEKVKIPSREVMIHQLKLVKNSRTSASFIACVSKGTYIRTLAHDIAHALGTVGVVTRLHRTKNGPFEIGQSVSLEKVNLEQILPLDCVLGKLPKLNVSSQIAHRLFCGQRIKDIELTQDFPENEPICLICDDTLLGIGVIQNNVIHPKWVLGLQNTK